MPYELEYKKVHNTLMGKRHDNIFGNSLRQKVTSPKKVGSDYIVDLSEYGETQLVIFNPLSGPSDHDIIFQVLENSSPISFNCVSFKEGSRYEKNGTVNIKCPIPPQDYWLVILPAKKTFLLDDSGFRWVTPDQIKISGSNFSVYYTKNNIINIVEDGIVVDYVETVTNGSSGNRVPVEDFDDIWTWDENGEADILSRAVDAVGQLRCSYTSATHKIKVQTNETNKGYLAEAYETLNLDLVLIPCRYYSDQNNIKTKRGTASMLKNINNARNERQQTYTRITTRPFVTNHYDASVFIEPIVIDFDNSVEWELHLDPVPVRNQQWNSLSVGTDLLLLENASRRQNNLYALHNPEKTLILCTACGYDHGTTGGTTCVGFAVGLQKRLPQNSLINAHSGCAIEYARYLPDITFDLPRHALASTSENDYPVIKIDIN